MAPKPLRDQITFDSLLEPITPLDPRIVTIKDPRWQQLLQEWVASPQKPTGLDVEYWEDTEGDVFSVQVRLVQAAFTSHTFGPVCFIADFGGVDEDRAALRRLYGDDGTQQHTQDGHTTNVPSYRPNSFLHALREVCESRTAAKLLHNAKGDALRLRIAFGIRMRNVRCTMILSQMYWAGVKGVRHGLGPLSERAVNTQAPHVWKVEKRLQKSEWRWRLSNAQINYAALDALIMEPLCSWLSTLMRKEGLSLSARAECDAICAFAEFEYNGMCVDPAMLDDHIAVWKRGRAAAIKPFHERYPDVSPSKPQEVAVALSQDNCYNGHVFYELDESRPRRSPVYIRGQRFDFSFLKKNDKYEKLSVGGKEHVPHSVSEAALVRFSHLPWVSALLDWRSMGVVVKWMEAVRRRVRVDGRVRGEYAQIAGGENRQGDEATSGAGMGRSACIARGTLVAVPGPYGPQRVPIERIRVGDWVYCYTNDGLITMRPVLAAWSNGERPVIRLHALGESLVLTADHRTRLSTGEYRAAGLLRPGDLVSSFCTDNRYPYAYPAYTEILLVEDLNQAAEVFDLTVDEFPNFIAGEICVHNCRSPSLQQSANPQPKLNRIIAQAMGWVGDAPSMSPRLPFVPHNEHAAAYLSWAAARLRGLAADPFQTALGYAETLEGEEDDTQQGGGSERSLEDDWSVNSDSEDDDAEDNGKPNVVASSAKWFEELAYQWANMPRCFLVADFSQAHMRIAAQASQDPQLCEDFLQDRDAHLKLAYDFGVATKQVPADLPEEAFFAWYNKKHPKHKFVKSIRGPAKTGNYTSLNLGSVERLKQAGDTAKPPVVLTYTEWGIIRDAWRKRYKGLLNYQQQHIRDCNATDVVIDGAHYGVAWSLVTGRRLWLRKERDKYDKREPRYCADCGQTHGRLTVRGTDAVAFRWLSTEACAIKYALGKMLEDFDRHDLYFMARGLVPYADVWDARMGSMAHDEVDVDARSQHRLAVAGCIRHWFAEGLRWSGVRDIPVEGGDARDVDLIVKCWADK